MRLQIEGFHSKEDGVIAKKNEITELQKALSDAHLCIYDERQQFLKLKREYDIIVSKFLELEP